MKNLLSIENLNRDQIEKLLDRAEFFLNADFDTLSKTQNLLGKTVAILFFEPSTRTQNSFILAAKKLGAIVLSPEISNSAVQKGETFLDTVRTFEAMGSSIFIIRHSENHILDHLPEKLNKNTRIINAGDGTHSHPSQALLDLLTIRQYKKKFENLRVAIIGDILRSRVANSCIQALSIMNTPEIRLIAPKEFLSKKFSSPYIKTFSSLKEGLQDADVVMSLRIQKERRSNAEFIDQEAFIKEFGLNTENIKFAKPDAIVLHPGPMNRGVEIDSALADGPQSCILQQVRNGVAMRMAILAGISD